MKKSILICLLLISVGAFAQSRITLRLELPLRTAVQPYYLASNINGWNPRDSNNVFKLSAQGAWEFTLPSTIPSLLEFKITKGSWENVESNLQGNNIPNRYLSSAGIKNDTTIIVKVLAWTDDFAKSTVSTASKNVHLLSDNFQFKKLGVQRRVWIYLPESYTKSQKKYPVLYMQDGQNLFDAKSAPFGEWGVDECLDTLMSQLNYEVIVVAVEHGAALRLSEYSPYDFTVSPDSVSTWKAQGKGRLYLDGLVNDLKPYVDANYRTKASKKNTFIAGSSMGGLISYYGTMFYPSVFSKAGVFSPAFWTVKEKVIEDTKNNSGLWYGSVFFMAGQLEGPRYARDMKEVHDLLVDKHKGELYYEVDPKGQHNEEFWRRRFPDFYRWLAETK